MPRTETPPQKRLGKTQPMDRIFAILETVANARQPLSLADISATSCLPMPTAHRLIGDLERRGFLKRALSSKRRLLPGIRLTELSRHALHAAIIGDRPHVILEQLASEVQEHCQIGTVTNDEVLYVDAVQVRRASGLQLEQGRSAPLHCTSMGKLYLASLDPESLSAWIRGRKLERITPRTITDPKLLFTHLRRVRKQGWATSDEEYGLGVVGCSVVVDTKAPHHFFAVGMSAPAARVPHGSLARFLPALKRASERITSALDGDSGVSLPSSLRTSTEAKGASTYRQAGK
jgi:IclR family transcriptional regulator, acetate operon repressor